MKSKYTILIICEGENTEPLFFNSIRDKIKDGRIDIGDVELTLRPEPKIEEDTEDEKNENEHRAYKSKKRTTKKVKTEPVPILGIPPLKWVEEGHRELQDGTFDEVWSVFDKDQHPKSKEAFELAEKEVNGRYVNIAFTSVCFEYYLLLHFERIYYDFEKSECHEKCKKTKKEIYFHCGLYTHPKDCDGHFCINGFARKNNYWTDSKGESSVFNIVEKYLFWGFANAEWVRFVSDKLDNKKPIHLRNPYLTVDHLVKRLIGETRKWTFIDINQIIAINKNIEFLVQNEKSLTIRNISNKTILIPKDSFEIFSFPPNVIKLKGDKLVLLKGEKSIIQISEWDITENETIVFNFEEDRVVFSFFSDFKRIKIQNIINKMTKFSSNEIIEISKIVLSELKYNVTSSK